MFWFKDSNTAQILAYIKVEFDRVEKKQEELMVAVCNHKTEVSDGFKQVKSELRDTILNQYISKLDFQEHISDMQAHNRTEYFSRGDLPNLKEVLTAEICDLSKTKFVPKEALSSLRREIYIAIISFTAAISSVAFVVDKLVKS